ncbi:CBS domain-containing membrane protein [Sulfitobacter undariae]|uniref:CBS domain-containing membrane protein n=1 Tax=Sulfitobacter undariae TaxID=1563671 RepID=A0A7W6E2P8_9RHOB|nr:HPP family protein [Sulfitobacter undariae]MBB3993667.1 CBS domain-containing membrane protein [Sulfitobacter undariae]
MSPLRKFLRTIGPAIPAAAPLEMLRAGLGALVALAVTGLIVLLPAFDKTLGLYLIAPFGASAVLLFAVPNSPLAQPWSALVGNTLAALIGVAVCLTIPHPALAVALAVGLTIAATIACRAVHPPAGAVAMTAVLNPDAVADLGFGFALAPVGAGTLALVILAAAYARLTGRRYPFRQFDDPNTHGTNDPAPSERLGLSEDELKAILSTYSQSFNLGVEDLARLVGAAEMQAATHATGPMTAADIMSRDLITVTANTSGSQIAALFQHHRFTSLPVADPQGTYLGIILQIDLIVKGSQDATRTRGRFMPALSNILRRDSNAPLRADQLMQSNGPRATPDTSMAVLLGLMADGETDAVPVLEHDKITGIVTRTDMIAALARHSRSTDAPQNNTVAD